MATVTENLTNITLASTTTGWSGFKLSGSGSAPSPQLDADIFIEGSNAVSVKISGTGRDQGHWFDNGSGIDMTVTGRHLWLWANYTTLANLSTIAAGGLYVCVSTSGAEGTDYLAYTVRGDDFFPEGGGWIRIVIDLNVTPTRSVGSTSLSSIQYVGIGVLQSGTAKTENLIIDRIDYGTGLTITGGTGVNPRAKWEALFEDDTLNANKFGVIDKRSGIYYLRGGIIIGSTNSGIDTLWEDSSGATVVFENPLYWNGTALVTAIDAANLYSIVGEGHVSNDTKIRFGDIVGTGDGRTGVNGGSVLSDGQKWLWDMEANIATLDEVRMAGVSLQGAASPQMSSFTKTVVAGCTFTNCDQVEANDADFLNNTIIAPVPFRGLELLVEGSHNVQQTSFVYSSSDNRALTDRVWQVDVSTTPDTFVEMTEEFNSTSVVNDVVFFPSTEAVGDYCAWGSEQLFGGLSITMGTVNGVAGVVTWEYWNGGWTTLEDVEDLTVGLTATGRNALTFKVPTDWVAVSLNGEKPLYYVRALIGTVYTTNPVGSLGAVQLVAEHMVHVVGAGTRDFETLTFSGSGTNKFDIEYPVAATSVDGYDPSNASTTVAIGNGSRGAIAQSFAGTAGTLSRVMFVLDHLGSVTGTIKAELYAHSGTFGTSSVPTGAPLATSNTIDVTEIGTLVKQFTFEFEDEVALAAATNYCIVLQGSAIVGGDGSNNIRVSYDNTSSSHAGNWSQFTSSWAAQATLDFVFEVWKDGILTVNALNGSDPTTDINSNVDPGAIIIVNAVNIKVTVKDKDGNLLSNVLVAVYTDDADGFELMNEDTVSGVSIESFNYSKDTNILIFVRESPNTASGRFFPFDTAGTITVDGYTTTVILQEDTIATLVF